MHNEDPSLNQKPETGTRLVSMFIDHVAMTIITGLFFIPTLVSGFSGIFELDHEPTNFQLWNGIDKLALFGFALYFCKDAINGRSIAKRFLKLQVINQQTGEVASALKCLVRNITIIIWPVEVIMSLANPGRRLGDMIAGTELVRYEPSEENRFRKKSWGQVSLSVVIAYAFMYLVAMPFNSLLDSHERNRFEYVKNSRNELAEEALKGQLNEAFEGNASADVRIYDEVRENNSLKFISVILRLEYNYLEDDDDFEALEGRVMRVIHADYPKDSFVGHVKYSYQGYRSRSMRTTPIY